MTADTSGRHLVCLLILLAVVWPVSAAEVEPLAPAIATLHPHGVPEAGSLVHDPATRKLYVGVRTFDRSRESLWIFDLDDAGQPIGKGRHYSDSNEALEPGHWTWPVVLLLDPARRKLYLGVEESHNATAKPLGVYELDARGEPVGPLRSFDSGNPLRSIQALARHPRLDRLYLVGWGGAALYHCELDTDGWPTGDGQAQPIGEYGKYSLAFRDDGTKVYLGTYPSTLEIADLDQQGQLTGAPKRLRVEDGPQRYLTFAAGARGLYFRGPAGRLSWWPIDEQGDPEPTPRLDTGIEVETLGLHSVLNCLDVAVPLTVRDALTEETVVTGTRLIQLSLQSDGTPGSESASSPPYPGRKTHLLAGNRGPGAVLGPFTAVKPANQLKGVELRVTLLSIDSATPLIPRREALALGEQQQYLRLTVSRKHNRGYAFADGNLISFSLQQSDLQNSRRCVIPVRNGTELMAIDEDRDRLYLATGEGGLESRTLDDAGIPSGEGRSLATSLEVIRRLIIHPGNGRVLALGQRREGMLPDPLVIPLHSAADVTDAVLDPVRGRLYAVSQYHGHENLAVWSLDTEGVPQAEEPRLYTDPFSQPFAVRRGPHRGNREAATGRGILSTIRLDTQRRKLYVGGMAENAEPREGYLIVYSLDKQGDPRDEPRSDTVKKQDGDARPRIYLSLNSGGSVWGLELDPRREWLYEAGWGDPRVFAWQLDERGEPTFAPTPHPVGDYGKRCLRFSNDGRQLLLGTHPSTVERLQFDSRGNPQSGVAAQLVSDRRTDPLPFLSADRFSNWVNLDDHLRDGTGRTVLKLQLTGAQVRSARLRFDVRKDALPGRPAKARSFEMQLSGSTAALILPRYGLDDPAGYLDQVETSTEYFERCAAIAERYAVPPKHRPQRFIVANGLIGMDSNPRAMEAGLRTLELLGHNTLQIWNWPGIAAEFLRERARDHGFSRFRGAVYAPPTYFHSDVAKIAPESLAAWAAEQRQLIHDMGALPSEAVLFHLADEPGWYYPHELAAVSQSPERLAVFHDYLKAQGLQPADLGASDWTGIRPLGQSRTQSLVDRRLHFWTMRFYSESFSAGLAAATAALQQQYSPRLLTTTNLNNWPGRFYIPSPGQPIANNADRGPDAAMGGPDWFDLARQKAVACLWTEDWFTDLDAGQWSLYADLMKSAVRGTDVEFGGYVVGHTTGTTGVPDGGLLKLLSLVGHGAKVIDPYTFGPHLSFPDGWSDHEGTYRSLSAAIELLGRAEPLLFPGRPRTAKVAIVFPQASQIWNADARLPCYQQELYGLHAALIHSQYSVDFLDDRSVEAGDLSRLGYRAVFVTAPDLSLRAQRELIAWTRAGGSLAVLPGACASDELHEPSAEFDQFLGVSRKAVPRALAVPLHELTSARHHPLTVTTPIQANANDTTPPATLETPHQIVTVAEPGDDVLVTTAEGAPVLARRRASEGWIYQFGFWPGCTYWSSPRRRDQTQLPRHWSREAREVISLIPQTAAVPQDVQLSTAVVEAALLESADGLAVTLLNWTGGPVPALRVTIPGISAVPRSVRSAAGSAVSVQHSGTVLEVTLPLATADVLMIVP